MLIAPRSGAVKYTPLPSGAQRRLSGSRSSLRERSRMPDPSIPTVHKSAVRCVCSEESEPVNAMVRPSGDTVGDSQNPGRATSERIEIGRASCRERGEIWGGDEAIHKETQQATRRK